MSETKALMENYRLVRDRFRNPVNAVVDRGIDLSITKTVVPLFNPRVAGGPPKRASQLPEVIEIVPFRPSEMTFPSILTAVAAAYDLSLDQIKLHSRNPKYSLPRQIAVYIATRLTKRSLSSLAQYLGMDHSTFIYGCKKIKKLILMDATLADRIHELEENLSAAFHRTSFPDKCEPLLGGETEQQDGNPWPDAVPEIPSVDC